MTAHAPIPAINFSFHSMSCTRWHVSSIDEEANRPPSGKPLRQGRLLRELRHARHMAPARPMPIPRPEHPWGGRIAPVTDWGWTTSKRKGGDHANAPHRALRPQSLWPVARACESGQVGPPSSARAVCELAASAARQRRRSTPRRPRKSATLKPPLSRAASGTIWRSQAESGGIAPG